MVFTAVIEQTPAYPNRIKYAAETGAFTETGDKSLFYERNVHQPYGWIKESGTPPSAHLDVIVMTDQQYALGSEVRVKIIGVFCRDDGDHKLVAVLEDRAADDFSELTDTEKADMHRLYPREGAGEGWFGCERAKQVVEAYFDANT